MQQDKEYFCSSFERELVIEICNNKDMGYGCAILYEMILSHKNINKIDSCFPSYNTLSKELDMSKSTITKYIDKLKKYGYLVVEKGDSKNSNKYYFPKSCMRATNYSVQDIKELFNIEIIEPLKQTIEEKPFDW